MGRLVVAGTERGLGRSRNPRQQGSDPGMSLRHRGNRVCVPGRRRPVASNDWNCCPRPVAEAARRGELRPRRLAPRPEDGDKPSLRGNPAHRGDNVICYPLYVRLQKTPRRMHTPTLHACREPQTPIGTPRNSPLNRVCDTTRKRPSAEHSVGVWNARVLRDVCSDDMTPRSRPRHVGGGDVPEWATLRDAQVVSSSTQAEVSTFRGPRSLITHIHRGLRG